VPVADPIPDVESFASAASDAISGHDGAAFQQLFREDGSWWSAGRAEPVGRDALPSWLDAGAALLPDAKVDVETWAGDESLVFLEWKATAQLGKESISVAGVDRFDLAAGLVLHGRSYFDTLELAGRLSGLTETTPADATKGSGE
jgi:limonene-1,2-epoxide hydrolase